MPSKLHNPQNALSQYLDEMLHPTGVETANQLVVEPPQRVLMPLELPVAQPHTELDSALMPLIAEIQSSSLTVAPARRSLQFDLPMQCLIFQLGPHRLAIPLMQLSAVLSWDGQLRSIPQSPAWILGLIKHRNRNLRVVDSYQLLQVPRSSDRLPQHLLVFDCDWAITCEDLGQVTNLDYEDIQWQQNNTRTWVLGTIRASLSTLLNPAGILEMLNSGNFKGSNDTPDIDIEN